MPPPGAVAQPATPPQGAIPQVAAPASPVPAPSPEEMRHRRLPVDIDSTKPQAVLERRVSFTESDGAYFFLPFRSTSAVWEQVCVSPCQVDLDRFSTYRVSGRNGVSGSKSFELPQQGDALKIDIKAGDLAAHRTGQALSGVGFAAVVVGAALVASKGAFADEDKIRNAGFITGGAGLVVMAVGIPLALLTQTDVVANGAKIAARTPFKWTF